MTHSEQWYVPLRRAERIALIIGLVFILISLPKGFLTTTRLLQSYLFSYLFCLELTLGSMAMLMLWVLTGGGFGAVTRRILEASTRTIYVMALLFLPILFSLKNIYPWADATKFDLKDFSHKSIYYDLSFFILRSVGYFASWILTAYLLDRWLNDEENKHNRRKAASLSAFALVLFGITTTLASIDWQMSLEPLWHSTIYGMVFAVGQAFGAWAFALLFFWIFVHASKSMVIPNKTLLDLGNILLTLVVLWAYLSFMQYLIVWSGNLPEEATWFLKRMRNGWEWLLLVLFLFQFAAPFSALLLRDVKKRGASIIVLTLSILFVRILDRYWMIMPSFSPDGIAVSYSDITLVIGLLGIWMSAFFWLLKKRSVFASHDPNWPEVKKVIYHA